MQNRGKILRGRNDTLPTCGVFASAADDGGIDASLKRAHKRSFSNDIATLDELLKSLAPHYRKNCIPRHHRRRLHRGNREHRPGTHARTRANVAFCPGTFHGCALIF